MAKSSAQHHTTSGLESWQQKLSELQTESNEEKSRTIKLNILFIYRYIYKKQSQWNLERRAQLKL